MPNEIKVRMQKVVGSKDTSINLMNVMSNFNPAESAVILDDVFNSDEFIMQIPEEPTDYLISEGPDGYAVEDFNMGDESEYLEYSLSEVLCATVSFYMNIQLYDWSVSRSAELKGITSNMLWRTQDNIRFFGDLYVELTDSMFDPFNCDREVFSEHKDVTLGSITKQDVADLITQYVDVLEFYCPNFPLDVQSSVYSIIREYKHIAGYELKMQ